MTRFQNPYATDGKCHNSQPGTFNHECGAPAVWIGVRKGWACGFCDQCRRHGFEARKITEWHEVNHA
jgi:hypothetical protein